MAEGRIKKRIVDGLKPDGRDFVKWDSELTGFGVRVRSSGAKSFVAVHRTGGRNSPLRKMTIGAVGKIEVEKAREAAREIVAGAELGQDHAAERAKARSELTVTEICELYLAEGCETKKALDRGYLRLGISRTGAKVVPLGAPAIEILAGVIPKEESPFVFPAASDESHFQGVEKLWRKVRAEAGFPTVRMHDFGRSFASVGWCAGMHYPL